MTGTFLSGPSVVAGPMFALTGGTPSPDYNPFAGPSITYQGDAVPDVRYFMQKDNQHVGTIPGHLNHPYFLLTDTSPATTSATVLASVASVTSGTPVALVATTGSGFSPGLTLIPATSSGVGPSPNSAPAVTVIGLDFGFAQASTASGTATMTPVRSGTATNAVPLLSVGQWVCVGGAGNASGTVGLFTKVTATSGTQITVSPAPAFTNAVAPIGSVNLYDPYYQAANSALQPTSVQPYLAGGLGLFLNPLETCSRNISITTGSSSPSGIFVVAGYDVYGQPQTERITGASGSTTAFGKKTFKYLASVTPSFTTAAGSGYKVGMGDTFGFMVRSDYWEYTNIFWAASFMTTQSGWTAGDLTSPATNSTGDVRGTVQVGVAGQGSGISGASSANGSLRLAIFTSIPLYNDLAANPALPSPMYGVVPA